MPIKSLKSINILSWFKHKWKHAMFLLFDASNNYDFNTIIGIYGENLVLQYFIFDLLFTMDLFLCFCFFVNADCRILILRLVQSTDSLHLLYLYVSYVVVKATTTICLCCLFLLMFSCLNCMIYENNILYDIIAEYILYYIINKLCIAYCFIEICFKNGMWFIWTRKTSLSRKSIIVRVQT